MAEIDPRSSNYRSAVSGARADAEIMARALTKLWTLAVHASNAPDYVSEDERAVVRTALESLNSLAAEIGCAPKVVSFRRPAFPRKGDNFTTRPDLNPPTGAA